MAETLEGTESVDTLSVPAHLALEGAALIYVCMNMKITRIRTLKAFLGFWMPVNNPISNRQQKMYLCRNSCFSWHQIWPASNFLCYTTKVQRYNFKCRPYRAKQKSKHSQILCLNLISCLSKFNIATEKGSMFLLEFIGVVFNNMTAKHLSRL